MTEATEGSLNQNGAGFYQHWRRINDWLQRHRGLWEPAPFTMYRPQWRDAYPELASWLVQLDVTQCMLYEDDPGQMISEIGRWLPALADYPALVAVPDLRPPAQALDRYALAERDAIGMPGRKRLQAGALGAALLPIDDPVLDWCCGKGHLARTLSRLAGRPVTGYEWDSALVEEGNRLVARFGDPVTLRQQDVMSPGLAWPDQVHATALHACGDLHRKLIRDGVNLGQPRLSFSPCCYHLTREQSYRPLSTRARAHAFAVNPEDLRLAVQETVTAPARVRAQREQIRQWRLGFDGLQRHLRQEDAYLPLPPSPTRLTRQGFKSFCEWAAHEKGLTVPAGTDWAYWLAHGQRRLDRVRRYELVRHLFRRPLELWVVLDYVLYLEEQGYRVRVGTFCERSLTPRNLLVDAVRQ